VDNSGEEPLSNFSENRTFASVLEARQLQRRSFLKGSVHTAVAAFIGAGLVACGSSSSNRNSSSSSSSSVSSSSSSSSAAPEVLLGFAGLAAGRGDSIQVPAGYTATAFVPWGTPLTGSLPPFADNGSNT